MKLGFGPKTFHPQLWRNLYKKQQINVIFV
jgi:hypothetical protein